MKRERLDLSNLTKPCDQQYDKYEGVEELLPFAKGISAKSHEFDEKGNDINTSRGGYSGCVYGSNNVW